MYLLGLSAYKFATVAVIHRYRFSIFSKGKMKIEKWHIVILRMLQKYHMFFIAKISVHHKDTRMNKNINIFMLNLCFRSHSTRNYDA